MRARLLVLALLTTMLAALTGCAAAPAAQVPAVVVLPTKMVRPMFTSTLVPPTVVRLVPTTTPLPTASPLPASATPGPATAMPEPPRALLTANDAANVRSGPGVVFARVGQLTRGQSYEITGKNPEGDWWEFNLDGKTGWVTAGMVSVNEAAGRVDVSQNLPVPPATPVPPPPPTPLPPTATPTDSAPKAFAFMGFEERMGNTNPRITVWCRVWDAAHRTFLAGNLRVYGMGQDVTISFMNTGRDADPGLNTQFKYNTNCKVELPWIEGNYTVVLVQGDRIISDPATLNAYGQTREFVPVFQKR